jgi:hypothetical protein
MPKRIIISVRKSRAEHAWVCPFSPLSFLNSDSETMGETTWIRGFRAWVSAELAPLVPETEDRRG